MFTAFCIEYNRYKEFLANEELSEWETYLPIQLDATCNGFQHLSLLSQESQLYESLNLTKSSHDQDPHDFYAFILSKLMLELKLLTKSCEDEAKKASLLRLQNFKWDRKLYKSIIMQHHTVVQIKKLKMRILLLLQKRIL